jgi:diguanylate cyclase (GGDEF)-like protein
MEVQESNDVVKAWKQEVLDSRGRDAERTLKSCLEIERYAKEHKDAALLGFAYFYSGETYYLLNDVEHMFHNIAQAIHLLGQTGQWELIARSYNLMAISSVNKGNVSAAMDYYLTGLNYCRKYGITKMEISIMQNLGNLYMENGVYHEAQSYFEQAYSYYKSNLTKKGNYVGLTAIYVNLARCYMLQGMLDKTRVYIEKLDSECESYYEDIDYLYVGCMKARYYHLIRSYARRDAQIAEIQEKIDKYVQIMEVFDDLYDFCNLMLEIDRDDVLWMVVGKLDEIVKNAGVVNLQRKVISLKIKGYRKNQDNASYLQAAGLYYELSEIMERENKDMIVNMLYVRSSLERANESRKQMEAVNVKLLEQSETDQLTGLANRYRLNDYSEKVLEYCFEHQLPLAMEILDIDFFKQYNDNYGHQQGDECITAIANQLKKMENGQTFCARYGGDEFIVIYAGMSAEEVRERAETLRQNIMNLKLEHLYSKALPIVTISQGISYGIPEKENRSWDFLHVADMLLYRVKARSRNDICLANLNGEEIEPPKQQEKVEP